MSADADIVFDAAMKLPEHERQALVSRLLATLLDEPASVLRNDPDLENELQRRSADRTGVVKWDEVRRELKLNKRN